MNEIPIGALARFVVDPPKDPKVCSIWRWKSGLVVGYTADGKIVVMSADRFYECDPQWIDEITPANDWIPGSKI